MSACSPPRLASRADRLQPAPRAAPSTSKLLQPVALRRQRAVPVDAGRRRRAAGGGCAAAPARQAGGVVSLALPRPSEDLFFRAVELAVSIEAAGADPSTPVETSSTVACAASSGAWARLDAVQASGRQLEPRAAQCAAARMSARCDGRGLSVPEQLHSSRATDCFVAGWLRAVDAGLRLYGACGEPGGNGSSHGAVGSLCAYSYLMRRRHVQTPRRRSTMARASKDDCGSRTCP